MLFKYTLVSADAEKMQELAKHIVIDVWCNARRTRPYDISIVSDAYNLSDGSIENFRAKVSRTPNLKNPIKKIYNICKSFTVLKKNYIRETFEINNNIEAICDNTISPRFYDDLRIHTSVNFSNKVKTFFNNLFDNIFKQEPFYLNHHYNNFMSVNKKLCPTCGLNTLEADTSNHRDDYDHYLPKKSYPFSAVNLKNLMPICSDCNKKWKKSENPIRYHNSIPKEAFYYYGTTNPDIEIKIIIQDIDACDIDVILMSNTMQDLVDTWNRIYHVGRRYKNDVICHDQVGKGWLRETKASLNRDISFNIDQEIDDAKLNFLENKNFLRAAFLEECKDKGLLFNEQNVLMNMLANLP